MNAEDLRLIRLAVPCLHVVPAWLIEIAWRRYSENEYAAGYIDVGEITLAGFSEWFHRQSTKRSN